MSTFSLSVRGQSQILLKDSEWTRDLTGYGETRQRQQSDDGLHDCDGLVAKRGCPANEVRMSLLPTSRVRSDHL